MRRCSSTPSQLAPTYRLIKGVPGRSYGISIARRLELPEDVVARAEERMPQGERDVAALIERSSRRRRSSRRASARRARCSTTRASASRTSSKREHNVREREREVEKESRTGGADVPARRARRNRAHDQGAARSRARRRPTRHRRAGRDARGAPRSWRRSRPTARSPRRRGAQPSQRKRGSVPPAERDACRGGDAVEVGTLGGKIGRVARACAARTAIVVVGVAQDDGAAVDACGRRDAPPETARELTSATLPEVHVRTEIDLRGLRADEVESAVLQALDGAVRADLQEPAHHPRQGNRRAARARRRDAAQGHARARVPPRRVERRRRGRHHRGCSRDPRRNRRARARERRHRRDHRRARRAQARQGTDYRGPCPFHQGTHRNFSVSPKKAMYYCFVCHEAGDVFNFLQKRLGIDLPTR